MGGGVSAAAPQEDSGQDQEGGTPHRNSCASSPFAHTMKGNVLLDTLKKMGTHGVSLTSSSC